MRITLWLTSVAVAAILIAVARPLIRRRIAPNAFYGLRVPPTFADTRVWYDANEASGRDLTGYAIALALVATILFWIPFLTDESFALAWAGTAVGGALTMLVVGWRRARRMLHERREQDRAEGRG